MDLSPLQLEGYYTKHLDFSLKGTVEEATTFVSPPGLQFLPVDFGEIDPFTIKVSVGGGPSRDDSSRWKFEISIQSNNSQENNYPYEFNISLVGFFKVFFNDPLGKDAELIRTNAISLLFSTAREMLASVSSSGPFPGVLLPSVSFIKSHFDQVRDVKSEKVEAQETKTKKSKATVAKKATSKARKR